MWPHFIYGIAEFLLLGKMMGRVSPPPAENLLIPLPHLEKSPPVDFQNNETLESWHTLRCLIEGEALIAGWGVCQKGGVGKFLKAREGGI